MLESFENCAECFQFPRIPVHLVFTAETEVVEPDVFAVLVVTCLKNSVTSYLVDNNI